MRGRSRQRQPRGEMRQGGQKRGVCGGEAAGSSGLGAARSFGCQAD